MQIRERATQYEENPQVDHNLEVRKKYNSFCITLKLIFFATYGNATRWIDIKALEKPFCSCTIRNEKVISYN